MNYNSSFTYDRIRSFFGQEFDTFNLTFRHFLCNLMFFPCVVMVLIGEFVKQIVYLQICTWNMCV